MITIFRTNSENKHFQDLVTELDKELAIRDGSDHSFYAQFNKIDSLKHTVVAFENNIAVGCGAFKKYSDDIAEIKRMYVPFNKRGQGIASIILAELEQWCTELHFTKCILETGIKQPEAIRLYTKQQYYIITNFGQYENIANSVCFEKCLND